MTEQEPNYKKIIASDLPHQLANEHWEMTEIPQEYKLTDELKEKIAVESCVLCPANQGEMCHTRYKLNKLCLESLGVADQILSVAMPLIEKRAREEILSELDILLLDGKCCPFAPNLEGWRLIPDKKWQSLRESK
jgi:hypothetical protein